MTPTPFASLTAFQDAFAAALDYEAAPHSQLAGLAAQPGFAVYRNGVVKHAIDALQGNFPAVARWTGECWFRAAAFCYVRAMAPRSPLLLEYGDGFPEFLRSFEPASAIPHVAEVARLDRMWTEAHIAPDAAVLDPARVAGLGPELLGGAVLHVHPSARWTWFGDGQVFTIWAGHRPHANVPCEPSADCEGALVLRKRECVTAWGLNAGEYAFLDCCAEGATLTDAVRAALEAAPQTDLEQLMCRLLAAGTFSSMSFPSHLDSELRDDHDSHRSRAR